MNFRDMLLKTAAAAVACSLLIMPCGCGEDDQLTEDRPFSPAISAADVSSADVSSSDTTIFGDDAAGPVYTIYQGAEAVNARDLEAYMATVDPESEAYDSTLEDTEYMFAHYRLTVSIDDIDIMSLSEDSAVVRVTQTTLPAAQEAPVSGSDVSASDVSASDIPAQLDGKDLTDKFVPCVTVLTHTLTCIGDRWYITSTVVESYREISTQWDLLGDITAADPQSLVLSGNLPVSPSDSVSAADTAN